MGKKLIIKGADFSEVAVEVGVVRNFIYNISDAQMSGASDLWNHSSGGFSVLDQSALQGKTIDGVRLNVHTAGTVKIYKATAVNPKSMSAMTLVSSMTARSEGIQNIDFDTPVSLGAGEFIVFGDANNVGGNTLRAKYHGSGGTSLPYQQKFYYKCGQSGAGTASTASFDVDFYQIDTGE